MSTIRLRLCITVATALCLASCFYGLSQDPAAENEPQLSQARGDAVHGKALFQDTCALCHKTSVSGPDPEKLGPGLKGISHKGSDTLSNGYQHQDHGEEVLRHMIVHGGGKMPAVGASLSGEDVNDLVAYLQSL
jgi:cytochrome c2